MSELTCYYEEPEAVEYLSLRQEVKMGSRSLSGAQKGLGNALFSVVYRDEQQQLIAMGRVIGDDGLAYMVTDVVVKPDYQGQGLAKGIMAEIMGYLEREAAPEAYICLIADVPANQLYEQFGFKETAPSSVAMFIKNKA